MLWKVHYMLKLYACEITNVWLVSILNIPLVTIYFPFYRRTIMYFSGIQSEVHNFKGPLTLTLLSTKPNPNWPSEQWTLSISKGPWYKKQAFGIVGWYLFRKEVLLLIYSQNSEQVTFTFTAAVFASQKCIPLCQNISYFSPRVLENVMTSWITYLVT